MPEKPAQREIPLKHNKELKRVPSTEPGMTHFFAGDGRMTSQGQSD